MGRTNGLGVVVSIRRLLAPNSFGGPKRSEFTSGLHLKHPSAVVFQRVGGRREPGRDEQPAAFHFAEGAREFGRADFLLQGSGVRGQGSGVRGQGSGVRGQESGVRGAPSLRTKDQGPRTKDKGPRES